MLGANGVPTPMPDDGKSAGYPTDQEIEQVAEWIRSLAADRVARPFVSLADQHVLARDDLNGQRTEHWERVRYLSLRVPHNDVDANAAKLDAFRTATLKLLNALSWNPRPFQYRQVTGDDYQILIRIFLPDLDCTTATWELREQHSTHTGPLWCHRWRPAAAPGDDRCSDTESCASTGLPCTRPSPRCTTTFRSFPTPWMRWRGRSWEVLCPWLSRVIEVGTRL